jgi:hypothetical protein
MKILVTGIFELDNLLADPLVSNKLSCAVSFADEYPKHVFPVTYNWFPVHEVHWWGYAPFYGAIQTYLRTYNPDKIALFHCHAGVNRSQSVAYVIAKAIARNKNFSASSLFANIKDYNWAKDRFEANKNKGYIPRDIESFLSYVALNPNKTMISALKEINSVNTYLSSNSEIQVRRVI